MSEQVKLFFRIYYRPLEAMSRIIDEGHWFYGAAAVLAVSLILQFALMAPARRPASNPPAVSQQPVAPEGSRPPAARRPAPRQESDEEGPAEAGPEEEPNSGQNIGARLSARLLQFFSPFAGWMTVPALALLYVPATILLMCLLENVGSFGVAFRRDYGALLACTLMAWAAAHLPLVLAAFVLVVADRGGVGGWVGFYLVSLAAKLYFAILMVCALRRIFGARFSRAAGTVSVSWVAMLFQSMLWMLASPFLLMCLWFYFRGEAAGLGSAFSSRQSFRRHLEAATINPKDSEAHYQLGLIYQQRHQYDKAIQHFQQSINVNHCETDAHYQLGRIARAQGRLPEAIDRFNEVVAQDSRHAHGEVWREIGATYLAAAMYEDARAALESFVERRAYDPEGLFHLGVTLHKLGRRAEAEEMFQRCVEAARTKLYDRGGQSRQWGKQAEKQLRSLRAIAL